jgi:exonuclease SbcD
MVCVRFDDAIWGPLVKFIHCADVHLDSPLRGLAAYAEAPADTIRGASRASFTAIVDLSITQQIDLLLIAGDLYDGDWRDFSTGLFFTRQMTRLREAGIPVFLIQGNHDALNQMTRSLKLPANVRILSAETPETVVLDALRIAIHGQSFARRDVTHNLASAYPPPVPGHFNIGILHTCLTGREGHDRYAPCDVEQLRSHGYDYWALGHIHQFEVVSENPHIVFPGNVQGRNIRETGPKGCVMVTVENGRITSLDRHFTDVMRWERILVDANGCDTPDDLLGRIRSAVATTVDDQDGRPLAVRIVIEGHCAAHVAVSRDPEWWRSEVRAAVIDSSGGRAWTEKISQSTRSNVDFTAIRQRDDSLGELMRTIDRQFGSGACGDTPPVPGHAGEGDTFAGLVAAIVTDVNQGVLTGLKSMYAPSPITKLDFVWSLNLPRRPACCRMRRTGGSTHSTGWPRRRAPLNGSRRHSATCGIDAPV